MAHAGGRPSKYDPTAHPKLARELTGCGRTLVDLAKAFGVNPDTITEWRHNHTEFSVAINLGREDAVDNVERSLQERATGYSHPSEKILVIDGAVERVATTEHYPPDTAAASLFLRNKRPKEWKDRTEVAVSGLDALSKRMDAARARAKNKPKC